MSYEISFDFFIPKKYKRRKIALSIEVSDLSEESLDLLIPNKACYLFVNPLEDEEEFLGSQSESDRQELIYYDKDRNFIYIQCLEYKIVTWRLMSRLESFLEKQY